MAVLLIFNFLYDISWLMANLSEPTARQANKEDGCTGRFYSLPSMALTLRTNWSCSNLFQKNLWEGRFKSQALLSDAAVLSCMAYVDLNPIRAKMAKTPKPQRTTAFKNEPRPYNKTNASLISYDPLSVTQGKTYPKVLLFRYKITVNRSTPQAALSEQMTQAFKTHTHRKRIGGMRQAKRLLS
jgi:hypothetical protein